MWEKRADEKFGDDGADERATMMAAEANGMEASVSVFGAYRNLCHSIHRQDRARVCSAFVGSLPGGFDVLLGSADRCRGVSQVHVDEVNVGWAICCPPTEWPAHHPGPSQAHHTTTFRALHRRNALIATELGVIFIKKIMHVFRTISGANQV